MPYHANLTAGACAMQKKRVWGKDGGGGMYSTLSHSWDQAFHMRNN